MAQITVAQAAAMRGVSRWAINRWFHAGLRYVWRNGQRWVDEAELRAYVPRSPGHPIHQVRRVTG